MTRPAGFAHKEARAARAQRHIGHVLINNHHCYLRQFHTCEHKRHGTRSSVRVLSSVIPLYNSATGCGKDVDSEHSSLSYCSAAHGRTFQESFRRWPIPYQFSFSMITCFLISQQRSVVHLICDTSVSVSLSLLTLEVTQCRDSPGRCHLHRFSSIFSCPCPQPPPQDKRGCLADSKNHTSNQFHSRQVWL